MFKWRVRHGPLRHSVLFHYGVLGMHWGIRKDEDMSSFIGPMPKYSVNDMSVSDFIQERGGLYSGDKGIVGRFNDPHGYDSPQVRASENDGVCDLGMATAFNHDAWNQAEERDRLGVIDYLYGARCSAMNSLLRDNMDQFNKVREQFGFDRDRIERSIDGMTKIMNNTLTTRDMITDRKIPSSALTGLLGVSEDMLKDRSALGDFIGSRIMDEGFFSTTLVADAKNAGNYGNVTLHTYIPEGTQAMYMEEPACLDPAIKEHRGYRNVRQESYDRHMYEVCLNRGSTFKVSGIRMDDNDNITDVFLDVIGQHGRDN